MLVVLAIMAIAASVVMLNMGPREPTLASEADRLARHLSAARDLAIARNRAVRVDLTASGYVALVESRMGWRPPDADRTVLAWLDGTQPVLPPDVATLSIAFDSIGISQPSVVTLRREREQQLIYVDGTGNISRERPQ
jgi:type II secretion system protein H